MPDLRQVSPGDFDLFDAGTWLQVEGAIVDRQISHLWSEPDAVMTRSVPDVIASVGGARQYAESLKQIIKPLIRIAARGRPLGRVDLRLRFEIVAEVRRGLVYYTL